MSNYSAVAHQAQVDQLAVEISGIINGIGGDVQQWSAPITHYGQVLEMIKAGASDEEISDKHPGWCGDVLRICHKIVEGTLSDPSELVITDEQHEKAKKKARVRERERQARYRRRYGKG